MKKIGIMFLSAVFLTGMTLLSPWAKAEAVEPLPYQEDFSSDPLWSTNNPANFKWDEVSGTYYSKSVLGSDEYSVVETNYSANSFRMEFDVKITQREANSETIFGLFGPTYTSYQTSPYDQPCIYVSLGGSENKFQLVAITDTGNQYSQGSMPDVVNLNKWYRIGIVYDSLNKRLAIRILDRDTKNWIWGGDSTINIADSFPTDMKYLGLSMKGEWGTSGPIQVAYIDELKLILSGAISGKITQVDGTTPIAGADIHLSIYSSGEYYDLPWDWRRSQSDGTYYISGFEQGSYRLQVWPPYGFGPKYYNDTESWSQATPVNVQEGVETSDINFTLPAGGEIRGTVYEPDGTTPIRDAEVNLVRADGSRYDFGSRTDANGAYITRVAYGDYKVRAGTNTAFMPEYYNDKPTFELADTVTVSVGSDAIGIDFTLDYGTSMLGLVLNQDLDRIPDARVHYYSEVFNTGQDTYTDRIGKFFFGAIPQGQTELMARPDVSSGYGWSSYDNSDIYISQDENIKNHPLICLSGALATGYIKDTAGEPLASAEYWAGSKNLDTWGRTDSNGRYQIRMPLGRHWINFDNWNTPGYSALPIEINVTDISTPIILPDMTAYDASSGASISGQVINSANYAHQGNFGIYAFKSGTVMDAETVYGLGTVNAIEDMETAGPYTLTSLPPTENYLVCLAVSNWETFPEYVSVRDFQDNLSPPATGIDLTYSSEGGTIVGKLLDAGNKPVIGAYVVFQRQSDNQFMGFGLTNQNGDFKLYNFEPGTFVATATHTRYANTPSTIVTVNDEQQTNVPVLVLTSNDEQAIRAGFAQFAVDFAAENINGCMSVFSDNYLHQGEIKEYMRNNFTELFNFCYGLSAQFEIKSIDIIGDKALVKSDSLMRGRMNADDRPYQGIGKDELNYFRKENGVWKVYGDQELFDYRVSVSYHPQYSPNTYHLNFMVRSQAVPIASVTVTGPDIPELNLSDGGGGSWNAFYQLITQPPVVGAVYTFTITDTASTVYTRTFTIKNIVKKAAVPVSPVGGVSVSGRPRFRWQDSPVAWGYGLEVFKGDWPDRVWSNFNIFGRNTTECLFDEDGSASEQLVNGQTYSWRVYVSDQDRNIAEAPTETFIYHNQAPVLVPIGSQTVNEGEKLEFVITATDDDGDALDYSAKNLPSGATFNPATRTFSWTPNFNQAAGSPYTVKFKVTDSNLGGEEDVAITVNNVIGFGTVMEQVGQADPTPSLGAKVQVLNIYRLPLIPPVSALTNAQGKFTLLGTIPDGNYILETSKADYATYSGIVIIRSSQAVPFRPTIWYAPIIGALSDVTIAENQSVTMTISATDQNPGDTLKFTATGLPASAQLVDNGNKTATFNWTPNYAQAGKYQLTLKVTDGLLSDEKTVNILVANTPIADLQISSLRAIATHPRMSLFMAFVANKGDKASGPFNIVWKVDGKEVSRSRVSNIKAGRFIPQVYKGRLARGKHSVSITVDSDNQVVESNEANNTKEIQVVVP